MLSCVLRNQNSLPRSNRIKSSAESNTSHPTRVREEETTGVVAILLLIGHSTVAPFPHIFSRRCVAAAVGAAALHLGILLRQSLLFLFFGQVFENHRIKLHIHRSHTCEFRLLICVSAIIVHVPLTGLTMIS